MGASRRRREPDAPAANIAPMATCKICFLPAVDATYEQVPEILAFSVRKSMGAEEFESLARRRLKVKKGCITFFLSHKSICSTTGVIGADGDVATVRQLEGAGCKWVPGQGWRK
jgi:hypothetical protein